MCLSHGGKSNKARKKLIRDASSLMLDVQILKTFDTTTCFEKEAWEPLLPGNNQTKSKAQTGSFDVKPQGPLESVLKIFRAA